MKFIGMSHNRSRRKRKTIICTQQVFSNIYYMVITAMLIFCTYYTVYNLLVDDQLRFFAFTIDTIYLNWNVSFPAVSVCEIYNGEKTWDLSEKLYGSDRNSKLDDLISDIAFFNGRCYACSLCDKDLSCPPNISDVSEKFRSTCNEMITNCSWNNNLIDCCDAFLPLETEYGKCFTINSIHTKPLFGYRLISNRVSGPGELSFVVHEDIQVHVHASNEVPRGNDADNYNIKENIFYGSNKEILIKLIDMVNDVSVQDVSIANRKCRFSWERDILAYPTIYDHYSYSACFVECSMGVQVEFCNCTHHLMPKRNNGNAKICDIDGLICLTNNFGKINAVKQNCECLASCEEPEFSTLYSSANEHYRDEAGSLIKIAMIDLPKERYVRHVVRTILDDVISIGSTISLLFGISIISALDYAFRFIKFLLSVRVRFPTKRLKRTWR